MAVGLAQGRDGGLLFPTLSSAWPVDHAAAFDGLLREIDEADSMSFSARHYAASADRLPRRIEEQRH